MRSIWVIMQARLKQSGRLLLKSSFGKSLCFFCVSLEGFSLSFLLYCYVSRTAMFPELLCFPNCYISRTAMVPELVKPSRDTCFFCNGNNKHASASLYCYVSRTGKAFKGHVLFLQWQQQATAAQPRRRSRLKLV